MEPSAGSAAPKRHYLPRALLNRFRGDTSLFELDRREEKVEARSVGNAAQEIDFYPDCIEHGILQRLDNDGPRVLRNTIDRGSYDLTAEQRYALAEWVTTFIVRVPLHLWTCEQLTEEWNDDVTNNLALLDDEFENAIDHLRRQNPEGFAAMEAQLGAERMKRVLYEGLREGILRRDRNVVATGRMVFERMIVCGRLPEYVRLLNERRWTWLESGDDFVIGDNPASRWLEGSPYNELKGFGLPGVQITFPLSRNLALWIHEQPGRPEVMKCDPHFARRLNRRQCETSVRYVYGPSRRALEAADGLPPSEF